ncbi:hypothetical protein EHQ30_14965 [Leptospira brenneri]|uniref:Uncharacterized protein n=1 Tax=Leptospira brenneri TaxID=2023182 RepID=A0A5F1Z3G6_9LEPT|nr:hypothetical protein EHQ30_14965 [Leptospira brenneri]
MKFLPDSIALVIPQLIMLIGPITAQPAFAPKEVASPIFHLFARPKSAPIPRVRPKTEYSGTPIAFSLLGRLIALTLSFTNSLAPLE